MYSLELQKIYFPLVFNMQKKKKRLLIKLSPCIDVDEWSARPEEIVDFHDFFMYCMVCMYVCYAMLQY